MLRIVVWTLSLLYGLFSALAASTQLGVGGGGSVAAGVMIAGGALLAAGVLASMRKRPGSLALAAAGCLFIAGAALYNGLSGGALSPSHHIIRLGISFLLVTGLYQLRANKGPQ